MRSWRAQAWPFKARCAPLATCKGFQTARVWVCGCVVTCWMMFTALFVITLTYGYHGDPATLALMNAARTGNMAALSSIVRSQGRGGINLDPAFLEASAYGRIKAMKFLVARGAHDFTGALVRASLRDQIGAVRYLLDSDACEIEEADLRLARLAAGGADSFEAEFLLVTRLMHP